MKDKPTLSQSLVVLLVKLRFFETAELIPVPYLLILFFFNALALKPSVLFRTRKYFVCISFIVLKFLDPNPDPDEAFP